MVLRGSLESCTMHSSSGLHEGGGSRRHSVRTGTALPEWLLFMATSFASCITACPPGTTRPTIELRGERRLSGACTLVIQRSTLARPLHRGLLSELLST
jgi:hypothetical protein